MKIIVTHFSPDLDAITSSWLIKNYLPGWKNASLKFVPAGETLNAKNPDENPEIIHVDTGKGRFDHHQTSEKTSTSKLVLNYLKREKFVEKNNIAILERLTEVVTFVDNFNEVFLPDPQADIYEFNLYQLTDSISNIFANDEKTSRFIFTLLDAVLINFKHKLQAEKEIKKGFILNSRWGKTLIMENKVEESIKLAQKKGYALVIRKNPDNGVLRIKARPDTKEGLEKLYQSLKKYDPRATWFFHSSGRMILNGSLKNPKTKPSSLTLAKIIEIVKEI